MRRLIAADDAREIVGAPMLRSAADEIGVRQNVRLLVNPSVGTPVTAGVLHPVIFLPADSAEWPEERLRVVLLHEMAHIAGHRAQRDPDRERLAQLAGDVHAAGNVLAHHRRLHRRLRGRPAAGGGG